MVEPVRPTPHEGPRDLGEKAGPLLKREAGEETLTRTRGSGLRGPCPAVGAVTVHRSGAGRGVTRVVAGLGRRSGLRPGPGQGRCAAAPAAEFGLRLARSSLASLKAYVPGGDRTRSPKAPSRRKRPQQSGSDGHPRLGRGATSVERSLIGL
jgi:hypothetical protein